MDFSKVRLHDVIYGIGGAYEIVGLILQAKLVPIPPDLNAGIVAGMAVIALVFTQLHKMGYDVPIEVDPLTPTIPHG